MIATNLFCDEPISNAINPTLPSTLPSTISIKRINPTFSSSTLSALSLRESVRENVKKPIVPSKPQHSPPHSVTVSSFGAKKDSGWEHWFRIKMEHSKGLNGKLMTEFFRYTSSRTSLEPSECGESSSNSSSSPNPPHFTLDEETNGRIPYSCQSKNR